MNQNTSQDKNITIRRSFKYRNLRLTVNKNGQVVLNIPLFCSTRQAYAFLEQYHDWIQKQQKKRTQKLTFSADMHLSLLGQDLQIRHIPNEHKYTHIQDNKLLVFGDERFIHRRIQDFIKTQTAFYIDKKAHELALSLNVKINKITMKDTTSRWGSCSGKNNLNFCWRLGLAPLYVLDYIIAHEVAHLKEMNHGPRFWKVVSELDNNRASAEIWLRRNGHELR